MIYAIILAAGKSERMGRPKLLLPFGEKTIIETVVENAVHSNVDRTVVVLGSDREKVEKRVKSFPVDIVVNPLFSDGMLSSVQCAFRAIPRDARAVLVLLGDQPSISSKIINQVIQAFERTRKGIVIPIHENHRGHPVLIDVKYRNEIGSLSPAIGLRELAHHHPEDIQEIEVDTPNILRDIDDLEDYHRERNSHPEY